MKLERDDLNSYFEDDEDILQILSFEVCRPMDAT